MKCTVFLAILSIMLTCGCASSRISYVVQMQDKKPIILNHQYRLEGIYCDCDIRQFHPFDHPLYPLYYGLYDRKKAAEIRQGIATELHNLLPKNFTASGKPFRINVTETKYEADIDRRKYLYYCISAGIIPVTLMEKFNILYEVQLLDEDERREAFEIDEVRENAMSFFSPFVFLSMTKILTLKKSNLFSVTILKVVFLGACGLNKIELSFCTINPSRMQWC